MNLANLLATGKSFFSGHGSPTYRASGRVIVPNFNGGKNPFTPKVGAEKKNLVALASPVASVAQAEKPRRVAAWAGKFNPFRVPEPVRTFSRAEQPELSLQTLKPLSNDLTEVDIERVPAKSHTLPLTPVKSEVGAWELATSAH